ncbi:cache domain-containing protein [Acidovorax sp.]|uniref:cache domain-containing protein n=1 Tax=Acidovorax sp. TaxID=1872122 RepID=UPI00391EEA02
MSFSSRRFFVAAAMFGLLSVNASAQEFGTRDEAKTMVDAAVEHVKKVGPDQAFKDFTNKENKAWQKKDLYVFAYTSAGVNVAHGANDKLVGKNLIELKDPNGKLLIQELRDTAKKGGGWVEYDWPHPQTKKIESKISYTRMMTNFDGFVGVGVYR